MIMLDKYAIRIAELEEVQKIIAERIKKLEDKAGYCGDFDKDFALAKEKFLKLIADRIEADDDEALFEILRALHELTSEVLTALKDGCPTDEE